MKKRTRVGLFALGVVILVVSTLLLAQPATPLTTEEDFAARCAAAGVRFCEGFDDTDLYARQATWPNNGLYNSDFGNINNIARDTSIKRSGAASMRMTVPAGVAASDVTGTYRGWLCGAAGVCNFNQNTRFFVQFALRVNTAMATNVWRAGGGLTSWKFHIFHESASSCGQIEITSIRNPWVGLLDATMYGRCGSLNYYSGPDNATVSGCGNCYLQQRDPATPTSGYSCQYNNEFRGSGNGSGCLTFDDPTNHNVWLTFYWDIKVGTWGSPNSVVKAYVAKNGGPYRQWINMTNLTLNPGSRGANQGWDYLTLGPYMTGMSQGAAASASMWYDELIVSTQPIAAPGGAGGGDASAPAVPTNLRVQ
jgi:hypothetical protein